MLAKVPFVEKDSEIQIAVRPVTIFQALFAALSGGSGAVAADDPAGLSCVAVMPSRRDVTAVTCSTMKDCRVGEIYIHSAGIWLFPSLTHPSQDAGIFCLQWMPLSDVLLCGTSTGVAMWSICSLFERETDKSWVNLLPHPRGIPVHEIQVCPTGRLFAAMTRGEGDFFVFDSYMKSSAALYCIRGTTCADLLWAPSGKFMLLGTHTGELVLYDVDSWERNDTNVYELGSSVGAMAWLTVSSCLVTPVRSLYIYTYTTMGGVAAANLTAGGIAELQGSDRHSIQNYPVAMSPIPYALDTASFEVALESSSVPWRELFIADVKTEQSAGLVAVSVSCTLEDKSDVFTAPVIAVYVASLTPQLCMTLIRLVSFDQFALQGLNINEQSPVSFEFRGPRKSRLSIRAQYGNSNRPDTSKIGGDRYNNGRQIGIIHTGETLSQSRLGISSIRTDGLLARSEAPAIVVLWSAGYISVDECSA